METTTLSPAERAVLLARRPKVARSQEAAIVDRTEPPDGGF
jgi:hypothetical protein